MSLQIARIARIRRRTADRLLSGHKLSEATAHPLLILSRRDQALGQGELAEEMGIEGPSLVRLIDLLEKEGLVERRDVPNDRRTKGVWLTAKGAETMQALRPHVLAHEERLVRGMTQDERALLVRLLTRMDDNLRAAKGAQDAA